MPRFFQGPRCTNSVRLDGKVAVITGANTGIGKETARDLSKRGAEIVIACRDIEKAEKAAQEIISQTNGKVSTLKLDLGSMASIHSAVEQLKSRHPKIHLLINNAGVMMCPRWTTEDGFEMQFGVNHLGHFLWTMLLLDTIKQSAPARIINLSSTAHIRGKIHFDDIMLEKGYSPIKSYCQSKLANILFTRELAKRLEGSGVTVYSVHPGVVETELGRHIKESTNSFVDGANKFLGRYFYKTAEMGAQTTVYCATDEKIISESGSYYSDCRKTRTASQGEDMEAAAKLWDLSEKLVKLQG